jgi:hypothetical protein
MDTEWPDESRQFMRRERLALRPRGPRPIILFDEFVQQLLGGNDGRGVVDQNPGHV